MGKALEASAARAATPPPRHARAHACTAAAQRGSRSCSSPLPRPAFQVGTLQLPVTRTGKRKVGGPGEVLLITRMM